MLLQVNGNTQILKCQIIRDCSILIHRRAIDSNSKRIWNSKTKTKQKQKNLLNKKWQKLSQIKGKDCKMHCQLYISFLNSSIGD